MVRFMKSDGELLLHARYSDKPDNLSLSEKNEIKTFFEKNEPNKESEDILKKFQKKYSAGKRIRKTKRR